jgi:uncharacterized protein involved in response to NO
MACEAAGMAIGRVRAPWALLADGFRPFFLLAAIEAALALVLWVADFTGLAALPGSWPGVLWHGHEMLWGFAAAGLAGFMLTAVPSWTGTAPLRGVRLLLLVLVWLAGRISMCGATALPAPLVALVDLAFLPLLAAAVAPKLIAGGARNLVLLAILALFWTGDILTHLGAAGRLADGGMAGLRLGIDTLLIAITLIGGRIIPAFTTNSLRRRGAGGLPHSLPALDGAAVLLMAGLAAGHWLLPASPGLGVLALAAAAAQGLRLARWRPWTARGEPLLAVLHLGYGWLVLGLALEGAALLSQGAWLPASSALHAETAGAIGTMLMAVMSRAGLGHTGRALRAPPAVIAAYALLSAGALLRVAGPLAGQATLALLALSGLAWALAWAIFAAVYAPILTRPRIDRAGE